MYFKGTSQTYLLKISITHNNKRIPSLNLFYNWISARLAPQILSVKVESTFRFSSFLIIGLCNSSANSWFEIISLLSVSPEDFQQIYKPIKQVCVDTHHVLDMSILKALTLNIPSAAVLLGKSLKLHNSRFESKVYLVRFDKYILNPLLL